MNLMSKGVLTAMTLALDFAAGAAIDNLWDAASGFQSIQQSVSPGVQTQTAAANGPDGLSAGHDKSKPGGGVCKPSERSVMVMEMSALGPSGKATAKHLCIRAMSGEPEFAKAFEVSPVFKPRQ